MIPAKPGMAVNEWDKIAEREIRLACKSILETTQFANAPRMGGLLKFLIEKAILGDERGVSEYAIGVEVFGRNPSDYSTGEDPSVRVQIGRLRSKLRTYYATGIDATGIEISIPLGSYMPQFKRTKLSRMEQQADCALALQPLKCIACSMDGEPFAQGLYEELVYQLLSAFGGIIVPSSAYTHFEHPNVPTATRNQANHLIEGSVRIDAQRIRTSVRLVDILFGRVTWSQHFDRNVHFAIEKQEELASSICGALKLHLYGKSNS